MIKSMLFLLNAIKAAGVRKIVTYAAIGSVSATAIYLYWDYTVSKKEVAILSTKNEELVQLVRETSSALKEIAKEQQIADELNVTLIHKIANLSNNVEKQKNAIENIKDPCLDYTLPDSFVDQFLQIKQ